MPKISVLFPIYNTRENFLIEAISSILNQTYVNFEFIIIDDCSTVPYISKVIKQFKDERIKFFQNESNIGISATRNKLVSLAQGEYLAIMDHDDISMPNRFEQQVAILDSNLEIGVVSCNFKNIPSGKVVIRPERDLDIKISLMKNCTLLHPAAMIRKSVLLDNNIKYKKELSPAEDYALWCDLIAHTKFYNIQKILFHYRNYANNTTSKQKKKMEMARLAIHAYNQITYPAIHQQYLLSATFTRRLNLFGILPIITIISSAYRTKIYLFEKILLLSYKTQMKIK